MKKIIVLTMLVLLAIGMPVLAGDVTFGGDFNIEAGSNFKEGYADKFDMSLDVSAVVDDYNTVSYELELDHMDATLGLYAVVDNPKLTTDVGAALGLADFGVGVVVNSGIFESASQEYLDFTAYEIEDNCYVEAALHGGAEAVLTFADLVNVELASDFDGAAKSWLVGSYGTVGPVSAEVFYACEGDSTADGKLIVNGVFSQELGMVALDAGAGFKYYLAGDEDATVATREYEYAVAVKAAADVGVAVDGDVAVIGNSEEDHILEALTVHVGVDPLEDLGLDVGAYMRMFKDAELIDNVEFSLWKKFGAAAYRVGYLYSPDAPDAGTHSDEAPFTGAVIDGGGFFMVVDIDY